MSAAISLYKFFQLDFIKEKLQGGIQTILEAYLTVMADIDLEELIVALERVVDEFEDQIEPFAVDLIKRLVDTYRKLVKADIEDRGETMMACTGLVSTMNRIVKAVAKNKSLLGQLEDELYPVLLHSMTPDGIEYFEEAIDIPIVLVSQ